MKTLKKAFISQQTYLYVIWVTDILKLYEVLFYTYGKGSLCLLKISHYAYVPLHIHKTLKTFGNVKE